MFYFTLVCDLLKAQMFIFTVPKSFLLFLRKSDVTVEFADAHFVEISASERKMLSMFWPDIFVYCRFDIESAPQMALTGLPAGFSTMIR